MDATPSALEIPQKRPLNRQTRISWPARSAVNCVIAEKSQIGRFLRTVVYQVPAEEKKLLIVAPARDTHYLLGGFLGRSGLPAARVDTGQQALEAAAQEPFGVILARAPLADLSVPALASGLTRRFSCNAQTPLLILAKGGQYEAALAYQSPRIAVVDITHASMNLDRAITAALGIAIRSPARLDVEVHLATTPQAPAVCRTRNISSSGMLLESADLFPVGTEFGFNFTLPERFTPIHGRAQVVRHADRLKESRPGMGVRFVDVPQGATEAIDSFVAQSHSFAH